MGSKDEASSQWPSQSMCQMWSHKSPSVRLPTNKISNIRGGKVSSGEKANKTTIRKVLLLDLKTKHVYT
jgi:hypothetical protein